MSAAVTVVLANAHDRLIEKLQSVFFDRTRNARDPLHFLVAHRRVTILVKVNLVATHVLGRIAGNVGRTHDACNVRTLFRNYYDTDGTARAGESVFPVKPVLLDRSANRFSHFHGPCLGAALQENAKFVTT